MELHEARARHAAEKLQTQTQTQHQPLGAVPMPGATHLSYPPGGNSPINKHI
uniref:Uncharacterized protein n=2 Tax=Cajanus cajan TaxID=3821 RepID=A0A151QTY0_CAJCA|nr:hypothetical protein KK1_045398 [Cajanus cajan]